MQCPSCDDGLVMGALNYPVSAPLKKKGGKIDLSGVRVTRALIQQAWLETDVSERYIACNSCSTQFTYIPGKGIRAIAQTEGEDTTAESDAEEVGTAEEPEEAEVEEPVADPPKVVRKFTFGKKAV